MITNTYEFVKKFAVFIFVQKAESLPFADKFPVPSHVVSTTQHKGQTNLFFGRRQYVQDGGISSLVFPIMSKFEPFMKAEREKISNPVAQYTAERSYHHIHAFT